MLAYIEGRILEKTDASVVLVTRDGVGYEVYVPNHTLMSLPSIGEAYYLYLAHVVREDAQELFGFATWDERQTFRMLITINRVGARTALAILSTYRPDDLRQMVARDDMHAITKVSGIGSQTGQKVFLELRHKMKGVVTGESTSQMLLGVSTVYGDALTGLMNLGYDEGYVSPILKEVLEAQPDLDVSEALRQSLKAMAKKN